MKRILGILFAVMGLFGTNIVAAQSGLLFDVIATGVPGNLEVTLCLNGKGPISCQKYTVSALTLAIKPAISGHNYPLVGIKINTPGYTPSGCTQISNGYCLFSMSSVSPAVVSITPETAIQYWVATNGNDAASGDFAHPFLTIAHAQSVVRLNPERGVHPIYININAGTYRLTTALTFDQNDSGTSAARVIYRAANGGHVVISGGQKITGWTLHDSGKNIWEAQGSMGIATIMPRQLYVNSKRATRARSSLYPNYYTPDASFGYAFNHVCDAGIVCPTWSNATAVEAVTVTQWKMMRCPVASVTSIGANQYNIVMQAPCWANANVYPSQWSFHLLSWF